MNLIYDKLFDYDDANQTIGIIGESIKQLSPTKFQISIKKGIHWHNGEEVTSDDILFSLNFWRNSKIKGHMIDMVNKAEIIDEYTITFSSAYAYSPLIPNIISNFYVVNKKKF